MCGTISNFLGGIFGTLLGAFIGAWMTLKAAKDSHRRDVEHERQKAQQKRKSWLSGLKAELGNIETDIDEIEKDTAKAGPTNNGTAWITPSVKRLYAGLLEASRVAWSDYESDLDFLTSVHAAFADVIHTNRMLEIFSNTKREELDNVRPSVQCSLQTVKERVSQLKKLVDDRLEGV